MGGLKLKQLESYLGGLQQFEKLKVELEQYPTGAHIAANMLYMVQSMYGDLEERTVLDLGCGCGILGIGAAMLGAEHVMGVDIDEDALSIAQENCAEMEVHMDLLLGDVRCIGAPSSSSLSPWTGRLVDTVVMNPPFGTRRKGADMEFLETALRLATGAVYSLHKTSTREHIQREAVKSFHAQSAEVLCQLRYNLPQLYKFHKRKEVDIEVDLWRFVPAKRQ
eukprot:TRINITY_DN4044_c0_g1_i2.p1 TRINITY_DN4044_c0_g1~~TRINITY_DN4044_c0_g1_i2.p1  ORF type:complete len:222 (-),score=47.94 TRINITY_DN4044_c0_g1_i2:1477-2142(-)